ncbi:MAG: peptidyl-prolyl cis-trans isomerase C [Paraglaciecola sp.]|jgi:peptidyl-prolyl cis-trans isomerase C
MSLTNTPEIVINGRKIDAAAIDTEIQYHPAQSRREAMVKAAETLIIRELILQRAEELALLAPSEQPDNEQESNLIDDLMDIEAKVPKATDEECKRYYQANPEKFVTSPLVEAKHILLLAEPKDVDRRAECKIIAEQVIKQLQQKEESFAQLALKYSACPSKETGGSLGQLSSGQTVAEFQRQVFASDEGLLPRPIESRFGLHVVYIDRKVPGKALPFSMVEAKIKQFLNDKVHRKAVAQYIEHLIGEADIQGFSFNPENSPLMQ